MYKNQARLDVKKDWQSHKLILTLPLKIKSATNAITT
jgi:hypothetical protein